MQAHVNVHIMVLQTAFSTEFLTALIAMEWFLSSMYAKMVLQVTASNEFLQALITLKWSLTRVSAHMFTKNAIGLERFTAFTAMVWPFIGVNMQVAPQIRPLTKSSAAVATTIWFLSCVNAFVNP